MLVYTLKRLAQTIFVLIGITLFVAFTIRLSGDPAVALFQGASGPTQEQLEQIRRELGLDRPFLVQYWDFVSGAVRGDLGTSFRSKQPVSEVIQSRFAATFWLATASLAISLLIAFPLGVMAARRHRKMPDLLIRVITLLGLSFPNFWLGIMLILIFGVKLRWLPPSGYENPQSLILPSVTLGLILASTTTRLIRSSLLDVLGEQYVVTAHSKGLSARRVLYGHALRTALIPIVTYIGLQFGALLGGVVIIEQVFAWPGLGSLALNAISFRDYPTLQGTITVLALLIAFINLLVDLSYAFLDPRIRYT
jgi:peptide/nickel transport system permease protein